MAYINYNTGLLQNNPNLLASSNDMFDVINGFANIDTVTYASLSAGIGVNVDLTIKGFQNTIGSNFDRLISIENITGSKYADTLSGDAGTNILNGGLGVDTVSYRRAGGAVFVDLSITVSQFTGAGGWDTLLKFENLTGSKFNDILKGNAGNNILNGGAGIDTVSYDNSGSGVTVSLSTASPQATGGAGTDTLISFENLIGSQLNDRLTGSSGDNTIRALNGDDMLYGTIGNDNLDGGGGQQDSVNYSNLGGPISLKDFGAVDKDPLGDDRFINIETVIASNGVGDTIDYGGIITAGSVTNLSLTATTTPSGLNFKVLDFENVNGTDLGDSIIGDDRANILSGGDDNDKISGLLGNDVVLGDGGEDYVNGGGNNDFLDGGSGKDQLEDTSGSDIFNVSEASDSSVASPDTITGFTTGLLSGVSDFIGLSMIDANTVVSTEDEAFTLLFNSFTPSYTGPGQLRWHVSGPDLLLYGNIDANPTSDDFAILILSCSSISFTNIIA
ncbi:MAG: calcium-binding protein [Cyanobacteriota bacterium]|nr:calcium-binding protein [Cyanobacteriota bacterium]